MPNSQTYNVNEFDRVLIASRVLCWSYTVCILCS